LLALGDREHEQHEAGRDEHGSGHVVTVTTGIAALRQQDRRKHERCRADRDVHEEDPLPGEELGQDPAEQDACHGAEAADGAPGAERDVALATLGEGRRHDRERGRCDRSCAQALDGARADERGLAPSKAAEQRAGREDDQPGEEDAPAPEDVGQASSKQQEAPEHERVRADHPLQVGLREPEVDLDRR
jgi:hypothetical protein